MRTNYKTNLENLQIVLSKYSWGEKVIVVAIMTQNFKVSVKNARLNTYFQVFLSGKRLETYKIRYFEPK